MKYDLILMFPSRLDNYVYMIHKRSLLNEKLLKNNLYSYRIWHIKCNIIQVKRLKNQNKIRRRNVKFLFFVKDIAVYQILYRFQFVLKYTFISKIFNRWTLYHTHTQFHSNIISPFFTLPKTKIPISNLIQLYCVWFNFVNVKLNDERKRRWNEKKK